MAVAQSGEIILSGFINDSVTGEALVGTNILLFRDSVKVDGIPYRGAASNYYGYYAIPKIVKGHYILVARNIGYKTVIREVNVNSDTGVVRFNINLTSTKIPLAEVLVTGKRRDEVKASTIDVPVDLLKRMPSLSGQIDLFKILEFLPGIKTASDISTGLYVRGGSPDQNLTLVDGVIVYNPTHLGNFASTFNSDAVQSVRLIKGAFPAEYGGRLSSVLDVKLKSGTKEANKGKIGLGLINSNATFEGPLGGKATYLISGRKMYYDVINKAINKNGNIPNYNFYDINSKFTYNISDNDIITISGMFSKDHVYNPENSNDVNYNIDWQNGAANIDWLRVNSKSFLINNSVSYVNYQFRTLLQNKTRNSASNDYFSLSRLQDIIFKTRLDMFWHENHTLKVGAELSLHNYDIIYSGVYNPLLETDPNGTSSVQSTEASLFFQDEWKVSSKLKTNIGGRFYYFKSKEYFKFEPRISASYSLTDDISIKGAVAIAHQFLHLMIRNDISLPTDLWYPSTKEVLPSRSTQYDLGMEARLGDNDFIINVDGYYRDMKNLYEFSNSPEFSYLDSSVKNLLTVGQGEAYGIEVFLNKLIGNFSGWVGYTLSWTKRQFNDLNLGRVYYPRYDRRNDISFVLSYRFSDAFSIGATWIFGTGQHISVATGEYQFKDIGPNGNTNFNFDYDQRNSHQLPNYHKLDISFNYKFMWNDLPFETYLAIFNVYNHDNPFAVYPSKVNSSGNVLSSPVLKQITLFPFLPTVGINVSF
ncbi:MAG TPA: TonB-dependent receptor plug domain-containing protein [Ignavibacteriaceae bacterium]|nr:TonB-dependent receptor plug domain-containing protein [Ignavibacteriaceae bacterium]